MEEVLETILIFNAWEKFNDVQLLLMSRPNGNKLITIHTKHVLFSNSSKKKHEKMKTNYVNKYIQVFKIG